MRSRPTLPFSDGWAEIHLGPSSFDIALVYPKRADLDLDYATLTSFRKSQCWPSGYRLRIEKTHRTPWLELACWTKDRSRRQPAPSICLRLARYAGDRPQIIQHLRRSAVIEICFMSIEGEEEIDRVIERFRNDGSVTYAVGTVPFRLSQVTIFGKVHLASCPVT